ncbi:MAG: hypothetical protein L0H63_09580 [Nitrococcus sp.]|nr:hypothetical protein [Nitrococcus sp.]
MRSELTIEVIVSSLLISRQVMLSITWSVSMFCRADDRILAARTVSRTGKNAKRRHRPPALEVVCDQAGLVPGRGHRL